MLITIAKLLSSLVSCFEVSEDWWTFEDSTADVQVTHIAGGEEIRLDLHLHFLGTAVLAACLQDAIAESGL